jgi:hypothetical protein
MPTLMRGIENSKVEAKIFIVICRAKDMMVFTDGLDDQRKF